MVWGSVPALACIVSLEISFPSSHKKRLIVCRVPHNKKSFSQILRIRSFTIPSVIEAMQVAHPEPVLLSALLVERVIAVEDANHQKRNKKNQENDRSFPHDMHPPLLGKEESRHNVFRQYIRMRSKINWKRNEEFTYSPRNMSHRSQIHLDISNSSNGRLLSLRTLNWFLYLEKSETFI